MVQMIHKIARREGIGDILADGVKSAASHFGGKAEQYAMHVKGQELPLHEPRVKRGLALHYALSPQGADHGETAHDPQYEFFGDPPHWYSELGLLESIDRLDLGPKKIRAFYTLQMVNSLYDCVGMCIFVGVSMGILPLSKLRDLVNAATGWDMSLYELLKVGERAKTMARAFNVLEGFTTADDTLPARMFDPLGENTGAGMAGKRLDRDEFELAVRSYYQMMGWDDSGVPTTGKLMELGLIGADEGSLDEAFRAVT
jgi:aldehyde:ferredoxin oxidoreductase